jgi:hypothetical protein
MGSDNTIKRLDPSGSLALYNKAVMQEEGRAQARKTTQSLQYKRHCATVSRIAPASKSTRDMFQDARKVFEAQIAHFKEAASQAAFTDKQATAFSRMFNALLMLEKAEHEHEQHWNFQGLSPEELNAKLNSLLQGETL